MLYKEVSNSEFSSRSKGILVTVSSDFLGMSLFQFIICGVIWLEIPISGVDSLPGLIWPCAQLWLVEVRASLFSLTKGAYMC